MTAQVRTKLHFDAFLERKAHLKILLVIVRGTLVSSNLTICFKASAFASLKIIFSSSFLLVFTHCFVIRGCL